MLRGRRYEVEYAIEKDGESSTRRTSKERTRKHRLQRTQIRPLKILDNPRHSGGDHFVADSEGHELLVCF